MFHLQKHREFLQLNFAVAILGMASLFARWIDLNPVTIIAARTFFSAPALFLFLYITKQSYQLQNRADFFSSLFTGVLLGIHWSTYFYSIQLSNVSTGMFTLFTFPVMTSFLEPFFQRRLPGLSDVVLSLYVLSGVYLFAPAIDLSDPYFRGILWGLFSAFLYTIRNIITKNQLRRRGSTNVMFYQLIFAFLTLSPMLFFTGDTLRIFSLNNILFVLALSIIITAFAHTLWMNSLKSFSATTSSIISSSAPVYGTLYASLLLGEIPSRNLVIGGAIILSGVLMEILRQNRINNRAPVN